MWRKFHRHIAASRLPQRFREELPKLFPEVDAFMGIDQVAQVAEIVQKAVAHRAERANVEQPTTNNQRSKAGAKRLNRGTKALPMPGLK